MPGFELEVPSGSGTAVSDAAYDATAWNGVTDVAPSKNAVRDKIEALAGGAVVGCALSAGAATSVANATVTAVAFDTEVFDTDGFHDNAVNNQRITIPAGRAGKYLFTAAVPFSANATGVRAVHFRKNAGSPYFGGELFGAGGTGGDVLTVSAAVILDLVAGDFVDVIAYHTSGGNLNTSTAPLLALFQAIRLGS